MRKYPKIKKDVMKAVRDSAKNYQWVRVNHCEYQIMARGQLVGGNRSEMKKMIAFNSFFKLFGGIDDFPSQSRVEMALDYYRNIVDAVWYLYKSEWDKSISDDCQYYLAPWDYKK